MSDKNNEEMPDFLKSEGEESLPEAPADLATAWAEAMKEPGEEAVDAPVEETADAATLAGAAATGAGDAAADLDASAAESQTAEAKFFEEDISATSTQAWSTFLSEETVADGKPAKKQQGESSSAPAQEPVVAAEDSAPETQPGDATQPAPAQPSSQTADKSESPAPEESAPRAAQENTATPSETAEPVLAQDQTSAKPQNDDLAAAQTQTPTDDLEATVVRRKSVFEAEGTRPGATTGAETPTNDAEPQWQPRQPELIGNDDPQISEATLLEGASIKPAKISRAAAHFYSLFFSVVALPFAWAFLMQSAHLFYGGRASQWASGTYSVQGMIFLGMGLVLLVLTGLAVRLSSLGMWVTGALVTVVGGLFVFAPGLVKPQVEPTLDWMADSTITPIQALSKIVESAAASGQLLVIGVVLLLVGLVGHSARRRGRTDQISQRALAKVLGTEQV